MSQENVELIRGLYDAFAKGDIPGVLGRLDPDIVWNEADNFPYADRSPYVGPQSILTGVFARLANEWDGFGCEVAEILDAGDRVIVFGHLLGTYRATGRSIRAQMMHDWTIAEAKATRFQEYTDTKQVADAVADTDDDAD
jgi:ketosteroid isomerase-like protein